MQGIEEPERSDRSDAGGERDLRSRPLTVAYEFVVVDGEEGKLVAARQVHAIRELLQWMADKGSQVRTDRTT